MAVNASNEQVVVEPMSPSNNLTKISALLNRYSYSLDPNRVDSSLLNSLKSTVRKPLISRSLNRMKLRARQTVCSTCKKLINGSGKHKNSHLSRKSQESAQKSSLHSTIKGSSSNLYDNRNSITCTPVLAQSLTSKSSVNLQEDPKSACDSALVKSQAAKRKQKDNLEAKLANLYSKRQLKTSPKNLQATIVDTNLKASPSIRISFATPDGVRKTSTIPPRSRTPTVDDVNATSSQFADPSDVATNSNSKKSKKSKKSKRKEKSRSKLSWSVIPEQSLSADKSSAEMESSHNQHEDCVQQDSDVKTDQPGSSLCKYRKIPRKKQYLQQTRQEVYDFKDDSADELPTVGKFSLKTPTKKCSIVLNKITQVNQTGSVNVTKGKTKSVSTQPVAPVATFINQVNSCQLLDGRCFSVNDIVWGKLARFPSWPGRILMLIELPMNNPRIPRSFEADVDWFGSKTRSRVHCNDLYPFLQFYNEKLNKKKKGAYRNAVKLATEAAQAAKQVDTLSSCKSNSRERSESYNEERDSQTLSDVTVPSIRDSVTTAPLSKPIVTKQPSSSLAAMPAAPLTDNPVALKPIIVSQPLSVTALKSSVVPQYEPISSPEPDTSDPKMKLHDQNRAPSNCDKVFCSSPSSLVSSFGSVGNVDRVVSSDVPLRSDRNVSSLSQHVPSNSRNNSKMNLHDEMLALHFPRSTVPSHIAAQKNFPNSLITPSMKATALQPSTMNTTAADVFAQRPMQMTSSYDFTTEKRDASFPSATNSLYDPEKWKTQLPILHPQGIKDNRMFQTLASINAPPNLLSSSRTASPSLQGQLDEQLSNPSITVPPLATIRSGHSDAHSHNKRSDANTAHEKLESNSLPVSQSLFGDFDADQLLPMDFLEFDSNTMSDMSSSSSFKPSTSSASVAPPPIGPTFSERNELIDELFGQNASTFETKSFGESATQLGGRVGDVTTPSFEDISDEENILL